MAIYGPRAFRGQLQVALKTRRLRFPYRHIPPQLPRRGNKLETVILNDISSNNNVNSDLVPNLI